MALASVRALLVVALVFDVVVTFVPWGYSGAAGRSSYELVRSADRLGLLDGFMASTAAVLWALVPLLAASAVLALVLERTGPAVLAGAVVGALLVGGWSVVVASPLRTATGATLGAVGGVVTAGLCAASAPRRRA